MDFDTKSLSNSIAERIKLLEKITKEKEKQLESAPKGRLRIQNRTRSKGYYWCQGDTGQNGIYIRKEDQELACRLAQKEYDNKILKLARKELNTLLRYEQILQSGNVDNLYLSYNEGRRKLVDPVVLPDDEFIESWLSESYEKKEMDERCENFFSDKGVQVRSKSEVLIASYLEKYGIPYKYERPIKLRGLGIVHPDFTCLNVSTKKEYIWEHFGMMDSERYANKNTNKISCYVQNGYFAGKNMIMTFETSTVPISTKVIKKQIEQYLL